MKLLEKNITIVVILGSLLFVILLFIIGYILLFHQNRHNEFIIEKRFLESQFQQTLLQSQLEIQEKTLKTISQEIHDNIGQVLSLAKLNLFTIDADDRANLDIKLKSSKELVSKAIVDLRDLSHTMNTDYIEDLGLMRSIEYELEMLHKTGVLKTKMEITGSVYKFDKQKELIAFRIVQEVLNNTIKHAQATNVTVNALFEPNFLELMITDNGIGINMGNSDNAYSNLGLGIKNMQSRATMIDGNFTIKSQPQNGTTITLTIFKENPPANEIK